ncbi:gametogenetin-binding protein 2-like [Drosophila grimshawi]|uniref:GH19191 n=1 Tax=Drosophila grimshawi TaxID=7222 RepID=B4JEV5_DROGR|nr:gametogenetin-binding protein 2-like [Drosophila grimshawi]EDV93236.1 GH19191 [Drosophila grimshawi]
MARLTKVYNTDDDDSSYVGRRHLPLVAGDKLMMLMDLNSKGLVIDSPQIRGRELEEFSRKFNLLTEMERQQSLEIDSGGFISVLNQCVQCVGCRRRVERLFYQLAESGHRTLDPLELRYDEKKKDCMLGITEEKLKTPQALGTLLYRHHEVLNNLLDNKLRNKTRCVLHSLDTFRAKPFSETWREVWSAMKSNCRTEVTIIETKELHEVLDKYLKKHKFCAGCRTKIERAYKILIGEVFTKEKGYAAQLYAHIRKCVPDEHIHVSTNKIEFLDALIKRAEPEVNGSYSKLRERHAKTLEIAQEEVLTCVGMIMYERLRRIYVSLREEERACQVLAAVGVHTLCRSFHERVEQKQGISNLELLYQEISRAEKAKELKREQKKLKKKKKKDEKKNLHRLCENDNNNNGNNNKHANEEAAESEDDEDDVEEDDVVNAEAADSQPQPVVVLVDDDDDDDAVDDDGIVIHCAEAEAEADIVEPKPSTPTSNKPTTKSKSKKQPKKKKQKSTTSKKSKKSPPACCTDNGQLDVAKAGKCNDCLAPMPNCPCEQDVRDSGYGSDPPTSHTSAISSPDGSEVSCSDGLCNHHDGLLPDDEERSVDDVAARNNYVSGLLYGRQQTQFDPNFSLLQMWDYFDDYDQDDENCCYIPQEVVLAYQYQREQVQLKRAQLRATLRENFERLCLQRGVHTGTSSSSTTKAAAAAAATSTGH